MLLKQILMQVAFTSDGKITALDLQLFSNGGASLDLSLGVSTLTCRYNNNF